MVAEGRDVRVWVYTLDVLWRTLRGMRFGKLIARFRKNIGKSFDSYGFWAAEAFGAGSTSAVIGVVYGGIAGFFAFAVAVLVVLALFGLLPIVLKVGVKPDRIAAVVIVVMTVTSFSFYAGYSANEPQPIGPSLQLEFFDVVTDGTLHFSVHNIGSETSVVREFRVCNTSRWRLVNYKTGESIAHPMDRSQPTPEIDRLSDFYWRSSGEHEIRCDAKDVVRLNLETAQIIYPGEVKLIQVGPYPSGWKISSRGVDSFQGGDVCPVELKADNATALLVLVCSSSDQNEGKGKNETKQP